MIAPAVAAPAACLAVLLGDWVNRRVRGWLPDDPPRPGRKQHDRPTPLAGVLLLPVVLLWLVPAREDWLTAAVTVAATLGFLDDRGKEHERELGWRLKTAALLIASALVALPAVDPFSAPWDFVVALGLVFVLANATNFLDNMDGVACALTATSLLFVTRGEGPLGAAGFAALGFLALNWPRPRVFLGDAGAYVLGLLVGAAVLPGARTDWTHLGAVAVQLFDFAQVLTARLVIGVAPWIGDRRHLTHIVLNAGVPRVLVAPSFAALGAILAALATGLIA